MASDLSVSLMTARAASTQNSLQVAVAKKAHDMESDLLNAMMHTALSPPPPGQGLKVDKPA